MTRIIKGSLLNLIVAILIAGLASNALSEETKRPGESAGCDAKLIDRLLAVMEMEIIPLTQEGVRNGNSVTTSRY